MKEKSAEKQLAEFIAKYSPEIGAVARAALAIGFGPTERASDAIFSIALYPRWVSLFFLQGAKLRDPNKLLKGSGNTIRSIVLKDAAKLDDPAMQALIAQALDGAATPIDAAQPGRMVIKSVSAKQRPRRPA